MDIPKVFIYGIQVNENGRGQPPYDFSADIVFIDRSSKGIHPSVYQMTSQVGNPEEVKKAEGLLMIGEVLSISRKHKKIFLADGNMVSYKYLILVTESQADVFQEQNAKEFIPALQALAEALKMQDRIPTLFGKNLTFLDVDQTPMKEKVSASYSARNTVPLPSNLQMQEASGLSSLGSREMDRLFEIVL